MLERKASKTLAGPKGSPTFVRKVDSCCSSSNDLWRSYCLQHGNLGDSPSYDEAVSSAEAHLHNFHPVFLLKSALNSSSSDS